MMAFFSRVANGLRALFHRRETEQELDQEIREYLEIATERKMAEGLNRRDALRAARVELGSIEAVKDRVRDAGWESVVDGLWQDVRYASRGLRSAPGFASVAILTLALGIGANTAIFNVVNSLLLSELPVKEPQRLAIVRTSEAAPGSVPGATVPWTYPIWEQIRAKASMFDGALAWSTVSFNLAERGETEPVRGLYASGEFFSTLGVQSLLGRTFTAADDVRSPNASVAVISYQLWRRRFGGAANVIGSSISIDRVPFTVIGVTPPDFFGAEVGETFDVALPLAAEEVVRGKDSFLDQRRAYWLTIMLRLRFDQTLDGGTAALRGMQRQIRDATVDPEAPLQSQSQFLTVPFTLAPAAGGTSRLRQQYQRPLLTMLVVVAVVLLIACANIANLLLARATARQHELSVRLALGAGRGRLVRQLLVESVILAGAGGAVGLLFAAWGGRALVAQLSTTANPVFLDLSIDSGMLGFTAAVALMTAVLFGTVPAFRATRTPAVEALKEFSRAGRGGRSMLSTGLVVGQVALSLALVVVAGLFLRTFDRLARVPLGFDSDRLLVVNVNLAQAAIAPGTGPAFRQRLVDAVAAVPGVASAAASELTPLGGRMWTFPVEIPGAPSLNERERSVRGHAITPGWLTTYGTGLRTGRDVTGFDTRAAPMVALVNEAFVRRFIGGGEAIGRTFTEPSPRRGEPVSRTIVGVVGDAIYRSLREDPAPTIYVPLAQRGGPGGSEVRISVRAAGGSPAALTRSVAAALMAVDPRLAFTFRPLEEQVRASLLQERLLAMLSAFFGGLALLLAGLGLYGVTSYAVNRRLGEIGIRVALGATASDVMRLVLGRSLAMTLGGIAIGLAGAAVATRYLKALLFGLTPLDPTTFVAVSLLFVIVATVAAFLPARRATKVDPLIALRAE